MEAIRRGSGEVRRINIVYFLCRNGAFEQPHLIRIHHLHRHGVRLRDVKRWLSELRGNDMPDSFAWSYKRRYRGGCVWQDLTDDDLITPISDNEYVLKGSSLLASSRDPFFASDDKKQVDEEEEEMKMGHETLQMDGSISPKPPPRSDEQSPLRALPPPLSSDEKKNAVKSSFFSMGSWGSMKRGEKEKRFIGDAVRKRGNEVIRSDSNNVTSAAGSHKQAAKSVIRNFIGGCMAVETKNSEIRIVQQQQQVEEF